MKNPRTAREAIRPAVFAACLAAMLLPACGTMDDADQALSDSPPDLVPTLVNPEHQSHKRKVAIARFSNETPYGGNELPGNGKKRIGRTLSDALAEQLARTGRFVLFTSNDPEPLLDALDRGRLADMNLPADYLITGSLTEFGQSLHGVCQ